MKRGGASEAALQGATLEELRDAGHWTNVRTASKYVADTPDLLEDLTTTSSRPKNLHSSKMIELTKCPKCSFCCLSTNVFFL